MSDPPLFLKSFFSVRRDLCGKFAPQRTHNKRSISTPAAAADGGSSISPASTSAQNSPRRVAAANAASSKVVRPEEAGPQISVRQPRGKPPVRASIAAMPLELISGAGRTARREAGTTPARIFDSGCLIGEYLIADADTPGFVSASKGKKRPWAAGVEITAEDINPLEISGSAGLEFMAGAAEANALVVSLFIRLLRLCSGRDHLSSGIKTGRLRAPKTGNRYSGQCPIKVLF